MKVAVVLLAAGSGVRFGSETNKVWLPLDDRRVITHSIKNAVGAFKSCRTVLVVSEADQELAKNVIAEELPDMQIEIVVGGQTRHGSEFNALNHLSKAIVEGELNVVLIHDGARPLASSDLFARVAKTAFDHGGALPSIDVDVGRLSEERTENGSDSDGPCVAIKNSHASSTVRASGP